MGGGSSDAAAALLALSRLWGMSLDLPSLARLGARLGADVPFFLGGGTALGSGKGDDVSPLDRAAADGGGGREAAVRRSDARRLRLVR